MNLSRLLLAGVLVTVPCACKKDDGNGTTPGDHETRTKSSHRQEEEGIPGKSGIRHSTSFDSREAADLIDAAEAAFTAYQDQSSRLAGIAVEESLAKSLNNEAELARVQEKLEEATKGSTEAERAYVKALDAVRSRQKKDPEEGLGAYVAFATQRDLLAVRQKEIAGAGGSDSEDAMKAREELKEEAAKLRQLRAVWKGEEKAAELPPEPGE